MKVHFLEHTSVFTYVYCACAIIVSAGQSQENKRLYLLQITAETDDWNKGD